MSFIAGVMGSTNVDADWGASARGKGTEVCFERIETCRNELGIVSILFTSLIFASEQRTSHLEVVSGSGTLNTQSPSLALDAPTDDSGAYSGVLHGVVVLTRLGESVGCWLGLGAFSFAASFKYPRAVSATGQS